jgi:hypothetical protein
LPIVPADPNYTLDQLNQFVSQSESRLLGPLTAIGNANGKTTIEIDDSDPAGKPTKSSKIAVGALPPGAIVIGTGQIFISGTLAQATAYKPA